MSGSMKKIIITVLILGLGFVVYLYFKGNDSGGVDLLVSNSDSPEQAADVLGQEILRALNQIEALQLDRGIFEDPVFLSLVDRSKEIAPEPVGRVNPFAPIGASADDSIPSSSTEVDSSIDSSDNNLSEDEPFL